VRGAYAAAAPAWAEAPNRIYQALADALVAATPVPLSGRRVADLGAGTGTVSRALGGAGAAVVAFDLVAEMLVQGGADRPPGAVADLTALPIATDGVDAAAAGFVLNHLADPGSALVEMVRIVRRGGAVLSSTFADQPRHPAKVVVDQTAAAFGYAEPRWYTSMKAEVEPLTAGADRLAGLADEAGLVEVAIVERSVDVGADTAEAIAAYRLSMAQLAPFVAGLDEDRRRDLRRAVVQALGPTVEPMRPVVLILAARVP
jgi:SAM-dependent methyltransferase